MKINFLKKLFRKPKISELNLLNHKISKISNDYTHIKLALTGLSKQLREIMEEIKKRK